jgi:hypothetical protein
MIKRGLFFVFLFILISLNFVSGESIDVNELKIFDNNELITYKDYDIQKEHSSIVQLTEEIYERYNAIVVLYVAGSTNDENLDKSAKNKFIDLRLHEKGVPLLNVLIYYEPKGKSVRIVYAEKCGLNKRAIAAISIMLEDDLDDALDFTSKALIFEDIDEIFDFNSYANKVVHRSFGGAIEKIGKEIGDRIKEGLICDEFTKVEPDPDISYFRNGVKNRKGKYKDNKEFIDNLYTKGIISKDEFIEINGEGFFNAQEDISYLKEKFRIDQCKLISGTGDLKKLDLLFIPSDFNGDLGEFYKIVNFDISQIYSTKPFSEMKDLLNFWILDDPDLELCDPWRGRIGDYCDNKKIDKARHKCPNDRIIVIVDTISNQAYTQWSSGSDNSNIIYYGEFYEGNIIVPVGGIGRRRKIVLHELGHSIGFLHDEYLVDKGQSPEGFDSKNCHIKSECEKVIGIGNCFEECTYENLYRKTENGIMRESNNTIYGEFNEEIIELELNKFKAGIRTTLDWYGRFLKK